MVNRKCIYSEKTRQSSRVSLLIKSKPNRQTDRNQDRKAQSRLGQGSRDPPTEGQRGEASLEAVHWAPGSRFWRHIWDLLLVTPDNESSLRGKNEKLSQLGFILEHYSPSPTTHRIREINTDWRREQRWSEFRMSRTWRGVRGVDCYLWCW